MLYVPPPDLEARHEILCVHTRPMKIGSDVDLKKIAEDTELFTGAELEGLCREAGIVALREDITASVVCGRHFQTVKDSLKPALTLADIDLYSTFMMTRSALPSQHSDLSPKNKGNSKRNLLGPVSLVKLGLVGCIFLVVAKYFLSEKYEVEQELMTT